MEIKIPIQITDLEQDGTLFYVGFTLFGISTKLELDSKPLDKKMPDAEPGLNSNMLELLTLGSYDITFTKRI